MVHFDAQLIKSDIGGLLDSRLVSHVPAANNTTLKLSSMTLVVQEAAIIDDLLYVLMGYSGQYIQFSEKYNPSRQTDRLAGPDFRLGKGIDPGLRDITKRMVQVAKHYSAVKAFVEIRSDASFGVVSHALCCSLRTLVSSTYLKVIVSLENTARSDPSFTLRTLQFRMQPIAKHLGLAFVICHAIIKSERSNDDEMDEYELLLQHGSDLDVSLSGLSLTSSNSTTTTPSYKICKGGSILSILTDQLNRHSGDPDAKVILETWLREASRPYMGMVNKWIHQGIISDPYNEFMIRQHPLRENTDYTDEYWDSRYTIRAQFPDLPPQFTDPRVYSKILITGKYLNVIRECTDDDGIVSVEDESHSLPQTIDDPSLYTIINNAHMRTNDVLLDLITRKTHDRCTLYDLLDSIKHYFFLDKSDFFTSFLDTAGYELKKPVSSVKVSMLQSLLDIAIRQQHQLITEQDRLVDKEPLPIVKLSSQGLTDWLMRVISVTGAQTDPQQEQASMQSNNSSSSSSRRAITGIEALQLDFEIPFPQSLVISRKAILRYQLLFRHLLSLKYTEQLVCNAWIEQTKTPSWRRQTSEPRLNRWRLRADNLRAKMLVYIQLLLYYCTSEIIEPNWVQFKTHIETIKDVDDLMQLHVDLLDTCLKECMLTNAKLLRVQAKLTSTCQIYAHYVSQLSKTLLCVDPGLVSGIQDAAIDLQRMQHLEDTLGQYETSFNHHIRVLIEALDYYAATETAVLQSLCAKLTMSLCN